MARPATMKDIDALAKELFVADNTTLSVLPDRALSRWWAAEDEATRLHYRRQAQQRLAAERYTKTADPL